MLRDARGLCPSLDATPKAGPGALAPCPPRFQLWIIPSILGSSNLYFLSDDDWETISAWIYGLGLCGLFVVSTVFHTISWKKSHLRYVCPTRGRGHMLGGVTWGQDPQRAKGCGRTQGWPWASGPEWMFLALSLPGAGQG